MTGDVGGTTSSNLESADWRVRGALACLAAVLIAGAFGCGEDTSERQDPLGTVRAFYEATLAGDARGACRLLAPTAKTLLTVEQPPPACENAIGQISSSLTAREREDMTSGLEADGAIRVTRHGSRADVDLASRDSSAAGIHLKRVAGKWRIGGIDPGAVDGGQPTGDAARIQRFQRHSR